MKGWAIASSTDGATSTDEAASGRGEAEGVAKVRATPAVGEREVPTGDAGDHVAEGEHDVAAAVGSDSAAAAALAGVWGGEGHG
eukprot:8428199-Alexandrium_andersonii.AAC.1